jgi:hypothetical protein
MSLWSPSSPADPLALDPLSPTGISPIEKVLAPDPLALDPLSPLPGAARPIEAGGRNSGPTGVVPRPLASS